jgi:hypothetical protein
MQLVFEITIVAAQPLPANDGEVGVQAVQIGNLDVGLINAASFLGRKGNCPASAPVRQTAGRRTRV